MTSLSPDTSDDKLMFVAGTLIHTPAGLVPIEQLRVGDLVTSRHVDRDERESRRVTATTSQDGLELCLMRLALASGTLIENLVFAGNRLMWTPEGWRRVDEMTDRPHVDIAGDPESLFIYALRLFETDIPDVAWTHDGRGVGPTVDLRGGRVGVTNFLTGDGADPSRDGCYRYIKRRVHGIDVEEFHTYFVGEHGVWVHDGTPMSP